MITKQAVKTTSVQTEYSHYCYYYFYFKPEFSSDNEGRNVLRQLTAKSNQANFYYSRHFFRSSDSRHMIRPRVQSSYAPPTRTSAHCNFYIANTSHYTPDQVTKCCIEHLGSDSPVNSSVQGVKICCFPAESPHPRTYARRGTNSTR